MTGLVSAALLALSLTASALLPPAPSGGEQAPDRAPAHAPRGTDPVWPLEPRPDLVNAFDPPERRWEAGHRGVDLAGYPGQDVRSALPGTVTFAGMLAGRGVVVVSHGDRRTTYEPVEASVRVGDVVEAGTSLGALQTGPGHCAPWVCLHWGLLDGTEYQDPLSLLQLGPVRLLPLLSPWARTPLQVDALGRGR